MLILSNKCGQLGNRLFAFAHIIAVSKAHHLKVINLSFDEYARYFKGTQKNLFCRYPYAESFVKSNFVRTILFVVNKAIVKMLRLIHFYKSWLHQIIVADLPSYAFNRTDYLNMNGDEFLEITKRKKICFLFGRFFRDYDNLNQYQELVRKYFAPIDEISNEVDCVCKKLKADSDVVVGVHIRRGDYAQFVDGKYFYSVEEYYRKMLEVNQCFKGKRVSFMVCSNEMVELEQFKGLTVTKGPGHVITDMYLLAKSDYIMGPPSTYTLWASFYGKKPICQIRDLSSPISLDKFLLLPPEVLYNFSFN